ncbi:DJ-1/PfpI family protein [Rhodococcus oryzae]|uniref:DJ-1/PfpI family protein n=1 Tax=Rhodococcus oryzae TaxID=2571143 RepID=UPI0037BAED52
MRNQVVHLAIYDTLADWETGHAIAHINQRQWQREPGRYSVSTVGQTLDPVTTNGGVRMIPDLVLADLDPEDSAMLILPGADAWIGGDALAPFAAKARTFLDSGVPVAAICGATYGLAGEGLLDDRDHTSNVAYFLAMTGYAGGGRYRDEPAVTDRDLITAGATNPVEFAREILGRLEVYTPEVLDAWYRLYARSDASAFEVLQAASAR